MSSPVVGQLPSPPPELRAAAARLEAIIRRTIARADGWIGFDRYMQLALYHPRWGYYRAPHSKFGAAGDFVTASGLGGLFGRCLARQCADILAQLPQPQLLEFGAGDGLLAADMLTQLERCRMLPQRYLILEVSAELQRRQYACLQQRVPHLLSKVVWLDRLPPAGFCGVMLANEVLDAMPVKRFCIGADRLAYALGVSVADRAFAWTAGATPLEPQLQQRLAAFDLPPGYTSELGLQAQAWMHSVAGRLHRGALIVLDYGFPQREYYHPDRSGGTLMCHYRQRAHSEPFVYPGLQDITAHVDFSALATTARQAGLTLQGYAAQGAFLLGCGALEWLAEAQAGAGPGDRRALSLSRQVKQLTLPHEMGELFKVMLLSRDMEMPFIGFQLQNRAGRL